MPARAETRPRRGIAPERKPEKPSGGRERSRWPGGGLSTREAGRGVSGGNRSAWTPHPDTIPRDTIRPGLQPRKAKDDQIHRGSVQKDRPLRSTGPARDASARDDREARRPPQTRISRRRERRAAPIMHPTRSPTGAQQQLVSWVAHPALDSEATNRHHGLPYARPGAAQCGAGARSIVPRLRCEAAGCTGFSESASNRQDGTPG